MFFSNLDAKFPTEKEIKMLSPKISVIIPVYKVEQYLATCLESVLAQTFDDFEVICVNDGSPDNCGKILEDYAKKDNRIKVITQENKGLSMARNQGLKVAKGEYIFFLDSDDCMHPDLLKITYMAAKKNKADLVSFHAVKLKADVPFIIKKFCKKECRGICTTHPLFYQKRWGRYYLHLNVWTKLFSKRSLKGLNFIPGITYEDYPFTYAVLLRHPKTVFLPIALYGYRYNPASISRSSFLPKHIRDYQTGILDVLTRTKKAPILDQIFIKIRVCPLLLKQQYRKIMKSPKTEQKDLLVAFTEELNEIQKMGFLTFWGMWGHFFTYKRLLNQWKK